MKQPQQFLIGPPWKDGAAFAQDGPKGQFDSEVIVTEKEVMVSLAVFADRAHVPSPDINHGVFVYRSHLDTLAVNTPNWVGRCKLWESLLFVNNSVSIDSVGKCVVIVDGDLEVTAPKPNPGLYGCVVVVNGNVTLSGGSSYIGAGESVLWATGDITFPENQSKPNRSVFLAGGKVAHAEKLAEKGCVTENLKEPPLPVRFLDPAEFGLTLETTKWGMKVAKLADKSAFAEVFKVGDVITAVTGVKTPTTPNFRRELRRGIVEGAAIFAVTRGEEKQELLAAVPDVPAAPKKKDEPKAKAPDKK